MQVLPAIKAGAKRSAKSFKHRGQAGQRATNERGWREEEEKEGTSDDARFSTPQEAQKRKVLAAPNTE